jgi:hypothetical protein
MKKAAKVTAGHEDWEPSRVGQRDLSPALPQLGLNKGEIQGGVDVSLLRAGQQAPPAVQPFLIEAQSSPPRPRCEFADMLGRARCQDQGDAVPLLVGQPHTGTRTINDLNAGPIRRLGDKGEIRGQLGATPDLSCWNDAGQLRMRAPQAGLQNPKVLGGVVDEPLPARAPQEFDRGQDLGLEGRTEARRVRQRVPSARCIKAVEARDSELAEKVEHSRRAQSRDGEHVQDAGRHLGPHGLETRCGALAMQALDRLGQSDTNAWHLPKPSLGNQSPSGSSSIPKGGLGGEGRTRT